MHQTLCFTLVSLSAISQMLGGEPGQNIFFDDWMRAPANSPDASLAVREQGCETALTKFRETWRWIAEKMKTTSEDLRDLAARPYGERLAATSYFRTTHFRDLSTRKNMIGSAPLANVDLCPASLVFSPDGDSIFDGKQLDKVILCSKKRLGESPSQDYISLDRRGHAFARLQQWAKATKSFAAIADAKPDHGWAQLRSADCAFMTEDAKLYKKHAKAALNYLETHRDEKKVRLHGRVARTVCLAPGVAEEYSLVEELAEETWTESPEFIDRTSLLFVQLQKGDHKKLLSLTNSLIPTRGRRQRGVCLLFRALALYHMKQVEAASEAFSEGMTALDGSLPPIGPGRDIGSERFDWLVVAMAVHRAATPVALKKMNAALEEDADNVKLLEHRALLHRRRRRWPEAADDFHQAARLAPDVEILEHAAVAALMADNPTRHHHWKGQPIEHAEQPDHCKGAWRAARVAALTPNSLPEAEMLLETVRTLARSFPTRWHIVIAEPALLYRLQRYEEVMSVLEGLKTRGAQWEDESVTVLLEGLARFHLGETERARKALSTADQLFAANAQPTGIIKRVGAITPVEVRLMRKELRKLLAKGVSEHGAEPRDEGAIP